MASSLSDYLDLSAEIIFETKKAISEQDVQQCVKWIVDILNKNGCLLICGNGGSASDAQHIAGELVGRFLIERKALNVICLNANTSVLTAWANDYSYDDVFSRQVEAHCVADNGILFCISTSGNSKNVVSAAKKAREKGMKVISMTGAGGGELANYSDCIFRVPSNSTPLIQQAHICLYHYLCEQIEKKII